MGINFNRVGDDYVAYGKRGPVFEGQENQNQGNDTVPVNQQKEETAPKTADQVLKESETLPQGYAVEKSNENPVERFKENGQKRMEEIEASMRKAGVEPKSLEYSGTWEDFIAPKTEDDAKYRYRQMRYNGQVDMTDEEIDEQAKLYMENKGRKDKFEKTHTYLDKSEYKKAEADKDAYYKELRSQGKSKKEAKAMAYEKFGENKYLSKGGWFGIGKSSARKYIERNSDLFYENGKFSDEKLHDYVLQNANIATQEGEETNYRYSLKECRVATEFSRADGRKTTVHQQGKLAKAAGMSTERNNTALYRGAFIAGVTGAGAAAGYAVGGLVLTSTSGSASGAAATAGAAATGAGAGAAASAGAAAGAVASVTIPAWVTATAGAVVGAGAGTGGSHFLRDNGEKIQHIQGIRPQVNPPVQPTVQPQPPIEQPPVEQQPVQPQPCPERAVSEKICSYKVQKGSSWAYYAENSGIEINGKKPAGKVLDAYLTAQQLMYGIQNPKGLKENHFLPVDSKYIQHSDFGKLFENEEIMKKYGSKLNILKDAKIDTSKCKDLNGSVRGRTPDGFRYGGHVNGNTTVRTHVYDCNDKLLRVEDK